VRMPDDVPDSAAPVGRVPAGIPGWRNAPCLGCGRRVSRSRDSWVTVGGTRSGSYLMLWGAMPIRAHATDSHRVPDEKLFVLGVAHQGCIDAARTRLEAGSVRLPTELPDLEMELGDQVPLPPYTLNLPAEISACPFCDSSNRLTREHVWPDWYSKVLQARGAILTGDIIVGNRIEVTVPVCGDCNNKWMSVLEGDAKQLLLPMADAATGSRPPVSLSAADQARLATWAVKTAYLIDAYQAPVIPRGFLHELALQRVPNACTVVWVGGYTPDVALRADKRALDFPTPAGEPTNNSPNAFVITFTILNVLFQIVGHFNGGTWSLRDNRRQYDGALFQIWPNAAPNLSWPPSLGFSRASWDDLVTSITDRHTE
jgi:hypothetical protein